MRPDVDVVVPFRGDREAMDGLRARLAALRLGDGDTLEVVDNTTTPGYGRNRGAELGSAEWLVFIDADVVPAADLLDRYFDPLPDPETCVMGGGVADEAVPADAPMAARYAHIRGLMNQDNTFGWGEWAFAQTVNAAVRREAFEAVGGFREDIRAAEDADLCFRLKRAGWRLERREAASVVHLSRASVRDFARQRMVHGAGGAWLDREYPGAVPKKRWPGLAWWAMRYAASHLAKAARHRDRDEVVLALLAPVENLSYEVGRSRGNQLPRP